MKRLLAVCSIGAAALAAGCGTKKLNIDEAERTMSERLGSRQGAEVKVDCPEDVEIKKGDTFNCRATVAAARSLCSPFSRCRALPIRRRGTAGPRARAR